MSAYYLSLTELQGLMFNSLKLGIVRHDKHLLLGHNLSFADDVLSVHHHVSFQLPVLFKPFPARLTLFGQFFDLLPVLRIRIRDLGSGIGCLFDPWIRDPGWEKASIRIRDEQHGS